MRIALVTETFLPSTDGVVTRLTRAVTFLKEQGHDVTVIAPDLGVSAYQGCPVIGMPVTRLPFYRYRPFSLPTREVAGILRRLKPDLVHAANPVLLAASAAKHAERMNLPLVCSYHTHIPKYLDYYKIFKPLKPLLWRYIRTQHRRAHVNLCTSGAIRKELTAQCVENLRVLPRGVDTVRRHPKYASQAMRQRLTGGEPEKTLLVFIGRLAIEKEIDRLLPLIRKRGDVRLAIVGDGPDRARLQQLFAGTRSVFTGFLHDEELSAAYASADAFLFPSVSETLGLVILESMASGTPVIAARSEPTCEQLQDGVNGLLFDAKDEQSLFAAVDRLNSPAIDLIRATARKEALENSWPNASAALLDAYETAVARARLQAPYRSTTTRVLETLHLK